MGQPEPTWERIAPGLYAEPSDGGDTLHVYADEYLDVIGVAKTKENIEQAEQMMVAAVKQAFNTDAIHVAEVFEV